MQQPAEGGVQLGIARMLANRILQQRERFGAQSKLLPLDCEGAGDPGIGACGRRRGVEAREGRADIVAGGGDSGQAEMSFRQGGIDAERLPKCGRRLLGLPQMPERRAPVRGGPRLTAVDMHRVLERCGGRMA